MIVPAAGPATTEHLPPPDLFSPQIAGKGGESLPPVTCSVKASR
jgi:hypothetical protein